MPERVADYLNIPEHSDLRGFSYHAPERFDFHDELRKHERPSLWQRIKDWFERRHG